MGTRSHSESEHSAERAAAGPSAESASVFAELLGTRPTPRRVTMTDLIGLVVGFAWAGKIFRDALGAGETGGFGRVVALGVGFVWLGLAMAGPIVLTMRRVQHGRRMQLTAGETLWVALGGLWLLVGACHTFQDFDPTTLANLATRAAAASAGIGPIALVILWHSQRRRPEAAQYTWCHRAGVVLGAAWPAAWVATLLIMNG